FSNLKKGIFVQNELVQINISLLDKERNTVGYCILDPKLNKCVSEGTLEKENNFSVNFLAKKNSEDYVFYLFPQSKSGSLENFEIGNIFVTKFNIAKEMKFAEQTADKKETSSKDITFDLKKIEIQGTNYLNTCYDTKGENQYVKLEGDSIFFSNKKSYCINLLEKTSLFKRNQADYLVYLNYSLENEKGVSICAGGNRECLTLDKLSPGKNIQKLVVMPKNSQNLRIDLVSITSKNSEFKINDLKIAEFDLESLVSLRKSYSEVESNYVDIEKTRVFTWLYLFEKTENSNAKFLTLNQDNQRGWVAFCGNNLCNFEGSLNGYGKVWNIEGFEGKVVIIYLPQILLFLGLVSLFVLILRVLYNRRNP
ncbi:MAG: hypothetical protein EBV07_01705, partial [Proteobacteria bacterium]|nr:hypothetical protein [Pseudomonadota bacterium]